MGKIGENRVNRENRENRANMANKPIVSNKDSVPKSIMSHKTTTTTINNNNKNKNKNKNKNNKNNSNTKRVECYPLAEFFISETNNFWFAKCLFNQQLY